MTTKTGDERGTRESAPRRRLVAAGVRLATGRTARAAFVLAALALGVLTVADQWGQVRTGLLRLGPAPMAGAFVAVLAALAATMLSWRAVLGGLGSPVPLTTAARIFFVGQLGKYLPGSVWPALAQMELGYRRGIPRARGVTAFALTLVISFATGGVVAAITLSATLGGAYLLLLLLVPVCLAVLHPRTLHFALDRLLRAARRPPLGDPPAARSMAVAAGWALVGWAAFGVHVLVLATALGAPAGRAWLPALGGYALAWCAGLAVVIAPAGAGVREVVLVAILAGAGVLTRADATVLALVSRVLVTVGDVLSALLAGATALRREVRGDGGGIAPP